MYIINIVNSFLGKKGNIGFRASKIINRLNEKNVKNYSYTRGSVKGHKSNNKNMGIIGHIPRILNAYRIYINLWFNHRKYDIKIFEFFFLRTFFDSADKVKIAHLWEYSPKIIKLLKSRGWKVILEVPIAPTASARKICKKFPNQVSLHCHNNIENLEVECYKSTDYIFAPSYFVKNELIKLGVGKRKIFTIPFGVDIKETKPKNFNKDYKKSGIDFCFMGTINKRKGIEFLLNAWNDEIFKNDRLHLCGRLYPEINALLNRYSFKNIITPGYVNPSKYLKECDVYVFPSLLEGSSKSIYEAMSHSMPCIVTENSGSIIENGQEGYVINIANENEIRSKMKKFKKDSSLIKKMGKRAYKKSESFSWDFYSKSVLEKYREISK